MAADCANEVGGSLAEVQARLLTVEIGFFDSGPLSVTTDASGEVVGYNSDAATYNYSFLAPDRGVINFNRRLNWWNPASSFGVDQNGFSMGVNPTAGYKAQVKAQNMSADQFVDLILLHELKHSFGGLHPRDETEYNRGIWTRCF
jgi:hypothetical protein